MSTSEQSPEAIALKDKIAKLGNDIRVAKTDKKPKDVWLPFVKEMNALKKEYEELTGVSLNPKKKKKKKQAAAAAGSGGKQLTKKQLRILKKQEAEAARKKKLAAGGKSFGELPFIQSRKQTNRKWTRFSELSSISGRDVLVRGRVHGLRVVSKKLIFVNLRQGIHTVQCVLSEGKNTPRAMLNFTKAIPTESIVDLTGKVKKTADPVQGCSISTVEIEIASIFTVHKPEESLPFSLEDACRSEKEIADGKTNVKLDLRLNYRHIDLRHPVNQSIFRVRSEIVACFREFLRSERFIEMHTPKILGGASEGGAEVFHLKYFGEDACLAQSPQLYKQMVSACSGFERCFEVGPVFRAEKSFTHRHLCEFTGMDFEMVIKEHYYECLDVFGRLFNFIFSEIPKRCKDELAIIQTKYPFRPLKSASPALLLTFQEGIQLLKNDGVDADPKADLTNAHEKRLGELVYEKYGTDFFMMDKYPMEARPFYTMPDPDNPEISNSYDMFIRGQEIVSGAQRVHDAAMLRKQAAAKGTPPESISEYIQSFCHGSHPHAGGGIGLDRVVFLFLGIPDIRLGTYFPRDPKRLRP